MASTPAPPPDRDFRVRRARWVALLLVGVAVTAPIATADYGTPLRIVTLVVLLVLLALLAERMTRAVRVRGGELQLRRFFLTRRVTLESLTELRAEKVSSGTGTQRTDFTRYHLADASGRRLSFFANVVGDTRRLAETLSGWAHSRGVTLDANTAALLASEAGGGLGGMFRDVGKLVWDATKQSRNR